MLGMGKEFTRADRLIYLATYTMIGCWTLVFIAGTICNLTNDVPDSTWASFWRLYVYVELVLAVVVVIWFTMGGLRDLKSMFGRLGATDRDDTDDGVVRDGSELLEDDVINPG